MNEQIKAIRNEIERRKKKYLFDDQPMTIGRYYEDRDLLSFIDSLPEEPNKSLEEAAGEYNKQVIEETKCHHNALTYAEGYEDALLLIPDAFIAGAQWQAEQNDKDLSEKIAAAYQLGLANKEEQMMKDAVEGTVHNFSSNKPHPTVLVDAKGFNQGDKVRIIIVKEK